MDSVAKIESDREISRWQETWLCLVPRIAALARD